MKLIKLQPEDSQISVISTQPKEWVEAMHQSRRLESFESLRTKKVTIHLMKLMDGRIATIRREFIGLRDGRPLIGDGRFCEWLVFVTPDLLRKSTPEGCLVTDRLNSYQKRRSYSRS